MGDKPVKQTKSNLPGAGPGRPKGVPNKVTGALKEMILQALEGAHADGGIGYLTQQAKDNPTAFLSLVGKVLPMTIAGDSNAPLVVNIKRFADG